MKSDALLYFISDSIEDDVQGAKELTLKAARKTKKEMDRDSGAEATDDCPAPDYRIYKVVLVE